MDTPKDPKSVQNWFEKLANSKEKLTKLHFFFHDIATGQNETAFDVARLNTSLQSPTFFGIVRVADDALRAGSQPESKIIGRAEGIYGAASLEESAFLMTLNLVFNATAVSVPLHDASPATTSDQSVPVNADDNPLSLSTAVTWAKISLRPLYRLFSKFPCHHRHKFYKDDPMRPLEIPNGNDMLVSSGENSEFQDPEALHGGWWQQVKLHHHQHHHHHDEDSDSDSDNDDEDEDDRIKRTVLKRRHFGGFDAEKKLKILKKHLRHENVEEEEHHHKKERDGFMIRVRKFFDHYF